MPVEVFDVQGPHVSTSTRLLTVILVKQLLPIYRSSGYIRLDGIRGEVCGDGGKMKVMSEMTDISSVASLLQWGLKC